MYTLYIIRNTKTERYYIGTTENLQRRLTQHNTGRVRSTKAYKPYTIIHTEQFSEKGTTRKREIQLKKSGHPERFEPHGPIV